MQRLPLPNGIRTDQLEIWQIDLRSQTPYLSADELRLLIQAEKWPNQWTNLQVCQLSVPAGYVAALAWPSTRFSRYTFLFLDSVRYLSRRFINRNL